MKAFPRQSNPQAMELRFVRSNGPPSSTSHRASTAETCELLYNPLKIPTSLLEVCRMQQEISLVDRGRGLQLSTSRITVHDLVPYFQAGCSHEEIIRWIPSLTPEEIQVVELHYQQHKDELDAYEQGSDVPRGTSSITAAKAPRVGRRTQGTTGSIKKALAATTRGEQG